MSRHRSRDPPGRATRSLNPANSRRKVSRVNRVNRVSRVNRVNPRMRGKARNQDRPSHNRVSLKAPRGSRTARAASSGTQRPAGQAGSLANSTGINPQQIGREWEERIQDAEKISELLREIDLRRARDIAQLAREMRRIDASRVFNDPQEIQLLRSQIIDGFKQLELDLFRGAGQVRPGPASAGFRRGNPSGVPVQGRGILPEAGGGPGLGGSNVRGGLGAATGGI